MTRRPLLHVLAGLTATALVTLAIVAQPATGATANLAADPGFESGLSGWTCSAASAVSSPTHSGAGAAAGTPAGQNFAQCSQQISVQPSSQPGTTRCAAPCRREARLRHDKSRRYLITATTRAGAAEAPTIFSGNTITSKPLGGSAPRLVSCSMCQ